MKLVNKYDKGKSGIYKITNLVNNKVYIGQSIDLWTRINEGYLQKLPKNKGHNKHLQRSWNKYGKENFIFEVVEYCNYEELDKSENYWISYYKSSNKGFGYNIYQDGKSPRGVERTEETKRKISEATTGNNNPFYGKHHTQETKSSLSLLKSKSIVQLDFDGNAIKIWTSVKDAAEFYNVARYALTSVLIKKTTTSCGFIWMYENEFNNFGFNKEEHFRRDKIKKSVVQMDLEGNYIKEFIHVNLAIRETGINNIRKVCNGILKSSGGFKWMYKEEFEKLHMNT